MIGREDYPSPPLVEDALDPDPFVVFRKWFNDAHERRAVQPDAMTLATVADGRPSARAVLLKQFDDSGFVFFTNYRSQKGREIAANPNVALCIVWLELHRQVRVVGTAEQITADESDAYFATRPRGAQIAAAASNQSSVLADRAELAAAFRRVEESVGQAVERPDHWGGYRVVPETIEFWQGQADRLHDRLQYRRQGSEWIRERLAP